MASKLSQLLKPTQVLTLFSRNLDQWTAIPTRKHRRTNVTLYPTVLQLPDGSTLNIQYHEPIEIIKLPLDLSTLSEAERKKKLERRIPKSKVKIVDDIDDDFDESRYLKIKKK